MLYIIIGFTKKQADIMCQAKLIIQGGETEADWERLCLSLTGSSNIIPFIIFNHEDVVFALHEDLVTAVATRHSGDLTVLIEGTDYTFSEDEWTVILSVLCDFLEQYIFPHMK